MSLVNSTFMNFDNDFNELSSNSSNLIDNFWSEGISLRSLIMILFISNYNHDTFSTFEFSFFGGFKRWSKIWYPTFHNVKRLIIVSDFCKIPLSLYHDLFNPLLTKSKPFLYTWIILALNNFTSKGIRCEQKWELSR